MVDSALIRRDVTKALSYLKSKGVVDLEPAEEKIAVQLVNTYFHEKYMTYSICLLYMFFCILKYNDKTLKLYRLYVSLKQNTHILR